MTRLRALVLVVAGPLLVLTYLLVQGAAPDAALHERTLDALRSLILDSAALQRDVLRARAGLLRNYDPLVQSVERLRASVAAVQGAGGIASGGARSDLERRVEVVAAAIGRQEALVEAFKSRDALLQNSLSYFVHASADLREAGDDRQAGLVGAIGAVGGAMLRFTGDPSPEAAVEATTSLDRLDRLVAARGPGGSAAAALVAHGRLIVATLPVVNDIVARLQADPTTEQVQVIQDSYLAAYKQAVARAGFFRILVYVAAVVLAAYVGHLFIRLRSNARLLQQRLSFEKLIADVSTQFIDLPRERLDEGIEEGLARLAEHAGVDRAAVVFPGPDGSAVARAHCWRRADLGDFAGAAEDLLRIATAGAPAGAGHQDYLYVPRVSAQPAGPLKESLERIGVRSWLSIPMGHSGSHSGNHSGSQSGSQSGSRTGDRRGGEGGFLVLATVSGEKQWLGDDIALVRTAGEIFANAIARERGEAERDALQARLREAQRLEAVGTLAGGIAHEFNNILNVILGYGEMTLPLLRKDSRARRHVLQIMKAGARAQKVVDQVLTFGRRRAWECRPVCAQAVIAEAIEFVRASVPATLVIELRLEAEDATLLGDSTELQQVLINLCVNAAHAMDGRGTLAVELEAVALAEPLVLSHGRLPPGRYLHLSVRDTGHGIDPAIMDRIFEPFFTTKAVGEGTGLGLATVHGIVVQHGGALDVESRPGAGTSFDAYLPLMDQASSEEADAVGQPVPHGSGETILLVDDEASLVLLGEEMLAGLGYEPVGFDSASAALAAFRADPQRFDLLLTDEVMPEMTGSELAVALRRVRPELPIVLMTGYAGETEPHRLQAAGVREVLRKPLLQRPTALCLSRHLAAR